MRYGISDITKHLTELNVELQGKQNLISLYDNRKSFRQNFGSDK